MNPWGSSVGPKAFRVIRIEVNPKPPIEAIAKPSARSMIKATIRVPRPATGHRCRSRSSGRSTPGGASCAGRIVRSRRGSRGTSGGAADRIASPADAADTGEAADEAAGALALGTRAGSPVGAGADGLGALALGEDGRASAADAAGGGEADGLAGALPGAAPQCRQAKPAGRDARQRSQTCGSITLPSP